MPPKYVKRDKIVYLIEKQGFSDVLEIAEICRVSVGYVRSVKNQIEAKRQMRLAGRQVG